MKTVLGILLALGLGTAPAWAVLGELQNSVALDQQRLRGALREETRAGYSIERITGANNMRVNEFVSPDGKVFGISWSGPAMPDLRQLLGPYFAEFQQARQAQTRRHGPLVMRTKHIVIESGGHMRAFRGRAFAPSLLPAGISVEVVR